MPFKTIPNVTINGSSSFANGYIYGCNFQMGYSENPTKVTFNLVPKDGATSFSLPSVNLTSEYTLNIGGIIFNKAVLIEVAEATSVGQKILNLTFMDGSYILDKVYVGLVNRHRRIGGGKKYDITVPAFCANCQGNTQKIDVNIKRELDGTANGVAYHDVDPKGGGIIILGIEQFVEGQCDIPEVAYNFTSLLAGIAAARISIEGIRDLNKDYMQSYTGTIREVLSNWCSDFGLTFYWDFTSNGIRFIDLKTPVINLRSIEQAVRTNSCVPIESINISKSLEGTYIQSIVSYYLKASRSKNNTLTRYEKKDWNNIGIEDICNTELSSGRNSGSFKVSCTLAKFYPTARSLYNFYYLGGGLPQGELALCMGLKLVKTLDVKFNQLFDAGFNIKTMEETFNKFPGGYLAIYYYSRDLESRWENFESNVADNFIGRFFTSSTPPKDISRCGQYAYYSKKYRSEPEGQKYTEKEKYENPLSKVLTNPNGYTIVENSYICEKDATWGTTQEEIDVILQSGDPLEDYKPIYLTIEGLAKQLLTSALEKLGQPINFGEEDGFVPVLAFIPDAGTVQGKFYITNSSGRNERAVIDEENRDGDEDEECETECEKSFVEELCENFTKTCSNPRPPSVGHRNNNADAINLTVGDGTTNIIYPLESNYKGYLEHNSETKWTIFGKKEVYGDIQKNNNVLSTKVIANNITNDYDDYSNNIDGNGILDVLVPEEGGVSIKRTTIESWHDRSSRALQNSVTEPQEKINFRVIGLDFSFLGSRLTPRDGLESIQVSYDENGFYADFAYSTRPKEIMAKEALFSRIGPNIKFNSQRSPQGSIARLETVQSKPNGGPRSTTS
jgi:hypothetical protein